jgi:hypothetical protein
MTVANDNIPDATAERLRIAQQTLQRAYDQTSLDLMILNAELARIRDIFLSLQTTGQGAAASAAEDATTEPDDLVVGVYGGDDDPPFRRRGADLPRAGAATAQIAPRAERP